jgi:hypothetical protein
LALEKERREFITLLGGAAAAWPMIGLLRSRSMERSMYLVSAFR